MTDPGRMAQVRPARSQLDVSAYFDEARFAREQARIFEHTPRYVGHRQMVPDVDDWRTLPQEGAGRVLVHTPRGVELLSNVCRHRQALMLGGAAGNVSVGSHGNLKTTGGNIVCPLHRWTYTPQGELLGAPLFDDKPCLNLQRFPLQDCHGLLFEGPGNPAAALAPLFARPEFDFSGYVLDHIEVHPCRAGRRRTGAWLQCRTLGGGLP